jgi:hypothetical protein
MSAMPSDSVPHQKRRWPLLTVTVTMTVLLSLLVYWLSDSVTANRIVAAAGGAITLVSFALYLISLRSRQDADGLSASGASLSELKDALAVKVRDEWGSELAALDLSSPEPIQVEWSYRPRHSTVDVNEAFGSPETVVKQVKCRDISTIGADWRASPARLTVVLGGMGSGKSTAAILLVHQLLRDRSEVDPGGLVPVLLHLSEWEPQSDLRAWITKYLSEQYQLPKPRKEASTSIVDRLVGDGGLLLVLDGFDEISANKRVRAVGEIKKVLAATQSRIVLASRIDEFDRAMQGFGRHLAETAVVYLKPVSTENAMAYLNAAKQSEEHWAAVDKVLAEEPNGPLAQALETPLMIYLLSRVYLGAKPSFEKLQAFRTREALERHLIGEFIPARYTRLDNHDDERSAEQVLRWFQFLALHLERGGVSSIAWWELRCSRPLLTRLVTLLPSNMVLGLTLSLLYGPAVGLWATLAGALVMATMSVNRYQYVYEPWIVRIRSRQLRRTLLRSFAPGLAVGLLAWMLAGTTIGVLSLGCCWLLGAMTATGMEQLPNQSVSRPREVFAASRSLVIVYMVMFGSTFTLIFGSLYGGMLAWAPPIWAGLAGLAAGIVTGLGVHDEWHVYHLTCASLALARPSRMPFRTMRFLDEAHRQGVLRQVGARYEFRHARIKEHLVETAQPMR